MIKDCVDHGVATPHKASEVEKASDVPSGLAQGRTRLAALYADRTTWQALPNWKPKHRERQCIDRRFDGPKHLRTRDYDSDEWGGGGIFDGGGYDSSDIGDY